MSPLMIGSASLEIILLILLIWAAFDNTSNFKEKRTRLITVGCFIIALPIYSIFVLHDEPITKKNLVEYDLKYTSDYNKLILNRLNFPEFLAIALVDTKVLSCPSKTSNVISIIKKGTRVNLVINKIKDKSVKLKSAYESSNGWYKIQYQSIQENSSSTIRARYKKIEGGVFQRI